MVMMVGSRHVQGSEGAGVVVKSAKVVGGVAYTVMSLGVGIFCGGYLGAWGLGKMVETYYDCKGDANKMRARNIELSVAVGGIGGSVVGGGVVVAVALNSLGLL